MFTAFLTYFSIKYDPKNFSFEDFCKELSLDIQETMENGTEDHIFIGYHYDYKEDVNENTIIVDIWINFTPEGKLCGDANKECYEIVKAYSPVPGGVGVMTNVVLMENLLKAYKKNNAF